MADTVTINTQYPIYARKINDNKPSRFSEAPVVLHKYSLNQALKERDEFRKSVNENFKQSEKKKKKRKFLGKFLTLAAAAGTFLFWKMKKGK